MRTPTQRLADMAIGEPIEDWIAERRAAGLSWRRISLELRDLTGTQIDVSVTTLINWHEAHAQQAAS